MNAPSGTMIVWEDISAPEIIEGTARALAAIEVTDPLAVKRCFQEKLRDLSDATRHVALYPTMYCLAKLHRPKRYLEVGVFRAYSTVVVAAAHPACDIVAMDDWSNADAVTTLEAARRIKRGGLTGQLTLMSGDSRNLIAPKLGIFDLILVDGGHTPEIMKADLASCAPLLAPGGHLVAHDIFASFAPAREALWRAFQKRHPEWKWFEHRPAPGIGIGRKPA